MFLDRRHWQGHVRRELFIGRQLNVEAVVIQLIAHDLVLSKRRAGARSAFVHLKIGRAVGVADTLGRILRLQVLKGRIGRLVHRTPPNHLERLSPVVHLDFTPVGVERRDFSAEIDKNERVMPKIRCAAIILVVLSGLAGAQSTRPSLEELRKAALGTHSVRSLDAIDQLAASGPQGRVIARSALRELLSRDRNVIRKAAEKSLDPAKLRELEAQSQESQRQTLKLARALRVNQDQARETQELYERFKQLNALRQQLEPFYRPRCDVYDALMRRPDLLKRWKELGDQEFSDADELELSGLGEKFLGMTPEKARPIMETGDGSFPEDTSLHGLRFYRVCRLIESYNASFESQLDPYEARCARLLAIYRECLGLWPHEMDERLIQSARRHSKWMDDHKLFAHDVDEPGLRTPTQRMKAAGYPWPGLENIAHGGADPLWPFWMWFHSPGHHQAMIADQNTLGVGRWGPYWTQNFGTGPRLMLLEKEKRPNLSIKGEVLAPRDEKPKTVWWALRNGARYFDPEAKQP